MTVELDFEYCHDADDDYEYETDSMMENTWKSYQNMVELFAFEDGLKDFFVHLASPSKRSSIPEPSLERTRRAQILERRIMGDDYDGEARGKHTRRGKSVYDEIRQERLKGVLLAGL
ncbi:hypothetical protein CVT26_000445 [Gymnopilus dilepis]|uniref:Uncharacterized protein n=1 Tax=Gymnopilus dilepis TaxID=231916 RepID=A0A409WL00_9AGAR|nr:hypothetical protein CVT26_000445 [Gymnopilus dilepis]